MLDSNSEVFRRVLRADLSLASFDSSCWSAGLGGLRYYLILLEQLQAEQPNYLAEAATAALDVYQTHMDKHSPHFIVSHIPDPDALFQHIPGGSLSSH
eukprot:1161314-Pelagomonas_calceolata.AAC.7